MPAALVTGSSRGIGRAIARRFAADEYDVALNYHSSEADAMEAVDEIEAATDSQAVALQANVGNPAEATELVERAVAELDELDHVVNNAGINEHIYTENLSVERFDEVVDVNLNSVYAVSKAAVEHLEASTVEHGPSIINLSSRLAFVGADYEPHYAASKGAIISLTKSHAHDFAPEVRVNAIAPGFVLSDMTEATSDEEDKARRRERIPLHRLGQVEDITHAAAYLRDAPQVTGETLHINGGQYMP